MDIMVWLMLAAAFITVASIIYGILAYYQNRQKLRERIKGGGQNQAVPLFRREERENPLKKRFLELVGRLGKWGVKDPQDATQMRLSLIQAGFRHPRASAVYFGLRALGAFILPLPVLMYCIVHGKATSANLLIAFIFSGVGFFLPQYFLKIITRRRQDRIDKALPDVLDLLIVCMEAGLAMQAAFNRVAEEIKSVSKDLHKELLITNAELRTGILRETALKNLGERTGVKAVNSLVGLMVQSDKMGVSVAQSLRTHAAFTRVQRGQKAEEIAAKLPVKILMPMIGFIFPAIFVVVLGPAIIQITKASFFTG